MNILYTAIAYLAISYVVFFAFTALTIRESSKEETRWFLPSLAFIGFFWPATIPVIAVIVAIEGIAKGTLDLADKLFGKKDKEN